MREPHGRPAISLAAQYSADRATLPAGDVDAVLLAGGRSSRMGREKTSMHVAGPGSPSLVDDRLDLLERSGVGRILVSWRRDLAVPASVAQAYGVIYDDVSGRGPLAGIVAGLRASLGRHMLVLAVDMPHVDEELVRSLLTRATPGSGVAPRAPAGHWEPLCAVYPAEALGPAESVLAGPRPSPSALLDVLDTLGSVEAIPLASDEARRLRSWNRPEDVRRARSAGPSPIRQFSVH